MTYCDGQKETGEKISARCSYPGYHCYCINLPHEYPSCQCSREIAPTTTPVPEFSTALPPVGGAAATWKPLYVLGIGGGVLLVVVLTSIACCCVCRHWYAQQPRAVPDKPPEYSDSPPPPYVHSSFYATNTHRPRTVHRIGAHPSASVTRHVSSAILQTSSRHNNVAPIGMVGSHSEHNMQNTRGMQNIESYPIIRTEECHRTISRGDIDRVRFPVGNTRPAGRFNSDDIAIVDLDEV